PAVGLLVVVLSLGRVSSWRQARRIERCSSATVAAGERRVPRCPDVLSSVSCVAESHQPRREQLGEGLVCCWIDSPPLREAARVARRAIRCEHWEVLEREYGEPAAEADHGDDEKWVRYYRQALLDKEVFAYNLSPRFPVFWVTAVVARKSSPEAAEA